MVKAPCKDCQNRQVGCHGTCSEYAEYIRTHVEETSAIRHEKCKADAITAYFAQQPKNMKAGRRGR